MSHLSSRCLRLVSALSLFVTSLGLPTVVVGGSPPLQPQSVKVFDVTISLYASPTTPEERALYEQIIGYFADGVYESSNGAHKIGRVSVYCGGDYADRADIVWVPECHPSAHVSGRVVEGAHIIMCDSFAHVNFLATDDARQWGGYTLAHEWGHYAYSLYDEYRGSPQDDNIISMPHSTDDPVPNSIMNSQWNALGGHFEWLNFSTAKNNTKNTAQHRVYGASGWETLARSVADDPRDGDLKALPKRIYYPELAGVAPGADDDPTIDLPGTARSNLEIVWISKSIHYQVVLDHSGSMNEDGKMVNAKTATQMLVDLAPVGRAKIGVIMFDDRVEVVQPLTEIDGQSTKDTIKAAIDTIQPANRTAIGDAARKALEDLLASGDSAANRVVFLLTDGLSNSGSDPLSVISDYQAARVPLFTFGYGYDADVNLLQRMAQETGGKFYFAPTGLSELTRAFQEACQSATPSEGLTTGSAMVRVSATSAIPIFVDSTLRGLSVVVTYQGAPSAIRLALADPGGNLVSVGTCRPSASETLCYVNVDMPAPGKWVLKADATNADTLITYRVSGYAENTFSYSASVTCLAGDVVQYPEPIVLLAVLAKELPISGAVVTATIRRPDGSTDIFPLQDDGVAPDAVASDGLYSAILDYSQEGTHDVAVQFDNTAGSAQLTYVGLQPSSGPGGKAVSLPAPFPIVENFQRFARSQIVVAGVASDDHGNTPQDATALLPANADVPGRIDYPGDLDVFAIRTSEAGEITVRVSDLALQMNPRLRILAPDSATVLGEGDLSTHATASGYLALTVRVGAGQIIFAEVSHRGPGHGGRYYISAGSWINSDGSQGGAAGTVVTPVQPPSTGWIAVLMLATLAATGGAAYAVSRGSPEANAGVQVIQGQAVCPSTGFRRGRLLIGRAAGCDLRLTDPTVSSRHALIRKTDHGYVITDLNSLNHTYVNEQQVSERLLQPGDEIRVGNTRLKFLLRRRKRAQ